MVSFTPANGPARFCRPPILNNRPSAAASVAALRRFDLSEG